MEKYFQILTTGSKYLWWPMQVTQKGIYSLAFYGYIKSEQELENEDLTEIKPIESVVGDKIKSMMTNRQDPKSKKVINEKIIKMLRSERNSQNATRCCILFAFQIFLLISVCYGKY